MSWLAQLARRMDMLLNSRRHAGRPQGQQPRLRQLWPRIGLFWSVFRAMKLLNGCDRPGR